MLQHALKNYGKMLILKQRTGNPSIWRSENAEKKSISGPFKVEKGSEWKSFVYYRGKTDRKNNTDS